MEDHSKEFLEDRLASLKVCVAVAFSLNHFNAAAWMDNKIAEIELTLAQFKKVQHD